MDYLEFLSNPQHRADNEAKKKFASDLLLAFKIKNISEGINVVQSTAIHEKIKNLQVSYPPQLHGGWSGTVDLINLGASGDVETCCMALQFAQVDDMTQPHHWFSNERRNWLVSQMKVWLGWP